MDHKKDIGKLLKDRLQDAEKTPNKNLWERLDNSLEKREKKRRVAAWLWYGSAGVLLLALFFTGYTMSKQEDWQTDNLVENTNDTVNTENVSQIKEAGKNQNTTAEKDVNSNVSVTNNTEGFNKENANNTIIKSTTKVITKSATTLKNSNNKQTTKANKAIKKAAAKNDPYADEGTVVKTSYQYYNSDTDTTSVNLNQRQMDSLMKANTPLINSDTLNPLQETIPPSSKDTLSNN